MKLERMLNIVKGNPNDISDDDLIEFATLKLVETFDPDLADEKQLDVAIRALGRAKVEIQGAIGALGEQYSQL